MSYVYEVCVCMFGKKNHQESATNTDKQGLYCTDDTQDSQSLNIFNIIILKCSYIGKLCLFETCCVYVCVYVCVCTEQPSS